MSTATRTSLITAAVAASILGCSNEPSTSGAPSASAPTPATAPQAASATAAAVTASAAPPAPPIQCPTGTAGEGTVAKPCEAKGKERTMEVTWTGKMSDTGPSFRVVNKSPSPILYGKIIAYFYDKAGKQLEVKDSAGKARPYLTCLGVNVFGGVMKPAEKAVITFSCIKKDQVPEGAAQIEAEAQMVGFADATEKRSEVMWRNSDLTPDVRPKGGVK